MSRHSEHHEKLNDQGEGKCGVPQWWGRGGDAGFCDKRAFGVQPPSRKWWNAHTGEYQREDGQRDRYGLCCPDHGGPRVRTFMDGNAWCAVHPDFVNLQESPAGFGATRDEAIAALATDSASALSERGDETNG